MSLYRTPTQPPDRSVARFWRRFARKQHDDPFVVLALQIRLGAVADLLQTIDSDTRMFARGQRWIATRNAYDALLGDACRVAGVPPAEAFTEDERLRVELDLASRGWNW